MDEVENCKLISKSRRYLPQFIAATIKNLLAFSWGSFHALPTLVIPSITGVSKELNPDEMLSISAAQASWLASLSFIGQPCGSILSGIISDKIGRRKTMILVNIPLIIAWYSLSYADSVTTIGAAFVLSGLAIGLMEAPLCTYVSEISEPSIRGMLLSTAPILGGLGATSTLSLGSFLSWRQTSFYCALVPIISLITIFFVPEAPMWLLSKGKTQDALKSLQWLRGWVSSDHVQNEYEKLQQFHRISYSCVECHKLSQECDHSESRYWDKIKEIKRKRNLKPFILCIMLEFFLEFTGISALHSYVIQILKAYGVPVDANLSTVYMSLLTFLASFTLLATIKLFGKRKIYLGSTIGTALACFALGIFGFIFLPPGWKSFKSNSESSNDNFILVREIVGDYGYIAFALFLILQFAYKMGVQPLPRAVMGEVFPFKLRSYMCGLVMAIRYVFATISTKLYYNVEMLISLPGAMCFYGLISLIGLTLMYFILPETEKQTLEDIELHFSDNSKRIYDTKIRSSKSESANNKLLDT